MTDDRDKDLEAVNAAEAERARLEALLRRERQIIDNVMRQVHGAIAKRQAHAQGTAGEEASAVVASAAVGVVVAHARWLQMVTLLPAVTEQVAAETTQALILERARLDAQLVVPAREVEVKA